MKRTKFAMKEAGQLLPPFEETLERFIAETPDIKITGLDKTHLSRLNTDKPIMTALEKLHQTVLALGKEINGLSGYTDRELQDLIDSIGILNSHIPTIEREACVREMAQFGLIDQ